MHRSLRVVIDLHRGEATLGQTVVAITDAGTGGELQVDGPTGPILQPLTFGARTRAVWRAVSSSQPRANVCAAILRAATVQPGAADQIVQEILALALSGAGQEEAPEFAEAALLVARSTGWHPDQLASAEAAEVDRLAIYLGRRQPQSGWNRIVLADHPAQELEVIRDELADDLLRRAHFSPEAATPDRDVFGSAQNTSASAHGRPEEVSRSAPASTAKSPLPSALAKTASRERATVAHGHDGPSNATWQSMVTPKAEAETASAQVPHQPGELPRAADVPMHSSAERRAKTFAFTTRLQPSSRHRHREASDNLASRDVKHQVTAPVTPLPTALHEPLSWPGSTFSAFRGEPLPSGPRGDRHHGAPHLDVMPEPVTSGRTGEPSADGLYDTRLSGIAGTPVPSADRSAGGDTLEELADALATLLHDEADMRGIER